MSDKDTIVDLQMRVMEQERHIEDLSQQILLQGKEIKTVSGKLEILEAKLKTLSETASEQSSAEVEIPPHY